MPILDIFVNSRGAVTGADRARDALGRYTRGATAAGAATGVVDKRMAALSTTSQFLARSLGGLIGAFAAIAAARAAVRTIAQFEETMATVQAVTRATTEDFQRLTDTARELGATTRFSAREAGEGLLFLSRAGFTTEESIAAVGATLNLAQAGMLELGEAADFASNIVSQFGLAADETVRVVDALVIVSNRSNTNVRQLAEAMKFAGPVAGALGISIEETAAAIGALGDSGIQASLAGTNLRGVLVGLLKPTTDGAAALERMGITLDEVDPSKKGLIEIFQRFKDVNLTAADAVDLFGRRNSAAALVLANAADKMVELRDATAEFGGEAQRVADAMNDTLIGAFLSLRSVVEEVFLQIGEAGFGGGLRTLVETMTGLFRVFTGMNASLGEAQERFEKLAEIVKTTSIFLVTLVGIRIIPFFVALTVGIVQATAAFLGFNAALLANPITFLPTIIATVVSALFVFRNELITVGDTTATLGDFIVATWTVVRDNVVFLVKALGEGVSIVWDLIRTNFGGLASGIETVWDNTIGALLGAIKRFANTSIGVLRTVSSTIGDVLGRLFNAAKALGEFDILSPIDSIRAVGRAIANELSPTAFLVGVQSTLRRELGTDFIGDALGLGTNIGEAIGDGLLGGVGFFKTQFGQFIDDITSRAGEAAGERAREAAETAVMGTEVAAVDAAATAAAALVELRPATQEAAEDVGRIVATSIIDAFSFGETIFKEAAEGIAFVLSPTRIRADTPVDFAGSAVLTGPGSAAAIAREASFDKFFAGLEANARLFRAQFTSAGALEVSDRFQGLASQFKAQQEPIVTTASNTGKLLEIARRQEQRDVNRGGLKSNIKVMSS